MYWFQCMFDFLHYCNEQLQSLFVCYFLHCIKIHFCAITKRAQSTKLVYNVKSLKCVSSLQTLICPQFIVMYNQLNDRPTIRLWTYEGTNSPTLVRWRRFKDLFWNDSHVFLLCMIDYLWTSIIWLEKSWPGDIVLSLQYYTVLNLEY